MVEACRPVRSEVWYFVECHFGVCIWADYSERGEEVGSEETGVYFFDHFLYHLSGLCVLTMIRFQMETMFKSTLF